MNKDAQLTANCGILVVTLSIVLSLSCGGGGSSTSSNATAPVVSTQNPLVAQYSMRASSANSTAWVEFGTDTKYGLQTSPTAASTAPGQVLTVLVAGMKANTLYHMRGHVDGPTGSYIDSDRTFKTSSLPTVSAGTSTPLTQPQITVSLPTPGLNPSPGVELFNLVEPGNSNMLRAFVTDLQGNIIWYYDPGPTSGDPVPMKLLQNGHFVLNVGDLREVDLAGNIVRDISFNQINQSLQAHGYSFSIIGFHHDLLPLPNGHWIVLSNVVKDFTNLTGYPGVTNVLGDALVDIDPTGEVAWAWNSFDHLDVNRHPLGLANFEGLGADWTHSNAILASADGNLYMSMRNQCWVLKIDYENGTGTGDILWHLGYQGDFTLADGTSDTWFFAQHFPVVYSDDGVHTTFAIWDNGDSRVYPDGSSCGPTIACYSRATIFQVDADSMEAILQWEDTPGYYNFWGGSIGILQYGDVEFDMTIPFGTAASRVQEVVGVGTPLTVWQLDLVGENAYRGYRIPSLYPGVSWQ